MRKEVDGRDRKIVVQEIIERLLSHQLTAEDAVNRLLYEMGRGGRTLVLDQMCYGLDPELSSMNYTVEVVKPDSQDWEIKKTLRANEIKCTQYLQSEYVI